MNLAFVGWALLCFAAAMVIGWPLLEEYLQERAALLERMVHFGEQFISEFERPLAGPDQIVRPVKSRVRCLPDRQRLDILLAPGDGRKYPNLADHRKNVEYDVARIAQSLTGPFKVERLYSQGPWVVVSFHHVTDTNRTKEGVA